jgi:hypothetical protein
MMGQLPDGLSMKSCRKENCILMFCAAAKERNVDIHTSLCRQLALALKSLAT